MYLIFYHNFPKHLKDASPLGGDIMNIQQLLEGIGFTRGEIKVYTALLELGPSTTGQIIKRAKVSRSKVYEMLDKLLAKGLVSFVVKEKIKYFEAAHPNMILQYVKKKQKQLAEKERALKDILPQLEKRQKLPKFRQTATVYEGLKGIKTVYNEIITSLRKGDEYYAIAVEPTIYLQTKFAVFIKNYHLRRAEKGIKVKLIADVALKSHISELAKTKLAELRYTDQNIPAAT